MPNIVLSEVTYGFAIVGGSTILGHHVQHLLPLPTCMGPAWAISLHGRSMGNRGDHLLRGWHRYIILGVEICS